jgi:hypothetical protein
MKKIALALSSLLVLGILMSSCTSNKKCGGRKAIKTPMGKM